MSVQWSLIVYNVVRVCPQPSCRFADGIPTLSTIAEMKLPPPAAPHPGFGETKEYAKYRKKLHYDHICKKVKELAKPKIDAIISLPSWDDKQDAVDELFEFVQEEMKKEEEILGKHPEFATWVDRALQEFLRSVSTDAEKDNADTEDDADETASPVYMDCYNAKEEGKTVPEILNPLKPHKKDGPGRMIEEWDLSAHKTTKRIMIRQSTRSIARFLLENETSRILVHGRKGVGKVSASLFTYECVVFYNN